MSVIKKLSEEMESWDKSEGASAVFWMYGWGKKKDLDAQEVENKNENDEDKEHRDVTHGNRNAKYLKKARFYANTPKARLKKDRTELRKDLHQ